MMQRPKVAAIVAMDEARVIGRNGTLPWDVPEDLAYFRRTTAGHVVLMGRKTWESLPDSVRPLPGRTNIVVSRRAPAELDLPEGVLRAASPEEGLSLATQAAMSQSKHVWVIGGAELYSALLPMCDEVHLTVIHGTHEGDAWLTDFESSFQSVSRREGEKCSFFVYTRK
jgi:dihydrofolate reductase